MLMVRCPQRILAQQGTVVVLANGALPQRKKLQNLCGKDQLIIGDSLDEITGGTSDATVIFNWSGSRGLLREYTVCAHLFFGSGTKAQISRPSKTATKHQKRIFSANCPMRGSRALSTIPKELELMFPLGFKNCAWLKMLKNSARNWAVTRSDIRYPSAETNQSYLYPDHEKNADESVFRAPNVSRLNAEVLKKGWPDLGFVK